jgi:hypothetical protein
MNCKFQLKKKNIVENVYRYFISNSSIF